MNNEGKINKAQTEEEIFYKRVKKKRDEEK